MKSDFELRINALAIEHYQKYHRSVQELKSRGMAFFNGCENRASRLLEDFKGIGKKGVVLVINSIDTLVHESGALVHYHHVVVDENRLVYDPNYTSAIPIPIDAYIQSAYHLPTNILIWRKGDTSNPIGKYDEKRGKLHINLPDFYG
ncbi:hypothetical protein HYW20_02145 [Candidatus Woesearchaeota archaeon]|nr:hypothetical protein [Candidatus Woesearchaeota archaeon]